MLHFQHIYIVIVCAFNQYDEATAFYERRICYNVPPKLVRLFALKIKNIGVLHSIVYFKAFPIPYHNVRGEKNVC